MKTISKVILKPENKVTMRVAAADIPLHLCLETMGEIGDIRDYQSNIAIEVGDVLLVKDAP